MLHHIGDVFVFDVNDHGMYLIVYRYICMKLYLTSVAFWSVGLCIICTT